ncbi:MAG: hypothetical protein M3Q19_07675 [Pseudomonadota bacterium]|nr:hypothetical protein [Pseudomonadota bacterium]
MSNLMEFLKYQDVGVESDGDALHIGLSLAEHLIAFGEMYEVIPAYLVIGETAVGSGVAVATTSTAVTVAGLGVAVAGPVLGMVGTFMALGSGYYEAREAIHNEAIQSGFSQGFVAGILRMSPTTVSSLFGRHGVMHRNAFDPEADAIEAKAYNKGLVAGYALAKTATDEQKKAFVLEIREHTGLVNRGDWDDRDKVNYVIEYAAKMRLHWLNELVSED